MRRTPFLVSFPHIWDARLDLCRSAERGRPMDRSRNAGSATTDESTSHAVIVIPCYNEAERLPVATLRRFARRHRRIRFLLVDDGSTDGTGDLLARFEADAPESFRCVQLPQNGGKAEAVRQGILRAVDEEPAYIGFWDADLATPLEPIPDFCRVLDGRPEIDLVIGARLPLLGHRIRRKRARRLLGRLFAMVASMLLRLRVYDTQCGAKLFRVTPELPALFSEPFLAKWVFDVEVFARLKRIGPSERVPESIYEYPLDQWRDVGSSKLKWHDFLRAFYDLAQIYWKYLRPGARPFLGSSTPGSATESRQRSRPTKPRRAA